MSRTTTEVWIDRTGPEGRGIERPVVDHCRQYERAAVLTYHIGEGRVQIFGDLTDFKVLGEGILRAVKGFEDCRDGA